MAEKKNLICTDDTCFFYISQQRYTYSQEKAIEKEALKIINNFLSLNIILQVGDKISVIAAEEEDDDDFTYVLFVVIERTFRDMGIIDFALEEVKNFHEITKEEYQDKKP